MSANDWGYVVFVAAALALGIYSVMRTPGLARIRQTGLVFIAASILLKLWIVDGRPPWPYAFDKGGVIVFGSIGVALLAAFWIAETASRRKKPET